MAGFAELPYRLTAAAENVGTRVARGSLADLRPMPRVQIDAGPQGSLYRYETADTADGLPILLVPPLAAPAMAFDLRRGCSLIEHLVTGDRRPYLVDYGNIAFADRHLGIEFWIKEVLPRAITAVSGDAGGAPVHVVGWCLGGIFSLLAAADRPDLPIASLTAVASPFDVTAVPLVAPLRPLANLTGGSLGTVAYRVLGGAPRWMVRRAFQLSSVDKFVTKPLAVLQHLDDREWLAQIEAVDRFTANMIAYPGRTMGQLYHRLFRANDLADGKINLDGREIDLAVITVPVLVVAGAGDNIAPERAVARLPELLTGSRQVRFEVAPGGHLGVLTGRAARTTSWPILDEWVRAHDEPRPKKASRKASRKASKRHTAS
ncbi:MAG TPA: alpha/beta fold hydrolase [Frankiaceae bacterium]|nr:alpha/beta fold hydrolase [Frankiaceae bacterium]